VEKKDARVATVHAKPAPPALATVSPLKAVAGENPSAVNLKDHPDLSGKSLVIVGCQFKEGDMGEYVLIACYVVDGPDVQPTEKDFTLVMTGSENVLNRLAIANQEHAFPVVGTLRQVGRAWFLD
jgi:hypothetical protein